MEEEGLLFAQVRSALADTLLCSSDSPPLRALPLDNLSGVLYLLFFDEDQVEILDRVEQNPSLFNFTFRRTLHASDGYREWLTILYIPPVMGYPLEYAFAVLILH